MKNEDHIRIIVLNICTQHHNVRNVYQLSHRGLTLPNQSKTCLFEYDIYYLSRLQAVLTSSGKNTILE